MLIIGQMILNQCHEQCTSLIIPSFQCRDLRHSDLQLSLCKACSIVRIVLAVAVT